MSKSKMLSTILLITKRYYQGFIHDSGNKVIVAFGGVVMVTEVLVARKVVAC